VDQGSVRRWKEKVENRLLAVLAVQFTANDHVFGMLKNIQGSEKSFKINEIEMN
jgi:hypothetical protein